MISIRVTMALACAVIASAILVEAQAPIDVRALVRSTYDFSPQHLNREQISEKSKILDAFWARVKADPAIYLDGIRRELEASDSPAFFRYDGSALLLSLSDTPADRRIALAAIARCDLRDIDGTAYLRQVHRLATLGADTSEAAFRVLEEPGFRAFIPQHALTLGQNYALVYMLLPLPEEVWTSAAAARLRTEGNEVAQKSLLLLLWYAQTAVGDASIRSFVESPSASVAARDYGRQLLERSVGTVTRLSAAFNSRGEADLRSQRRETMKRLSDEALHELDDITRALIARRR